MIRSVKQYKAQFYKWGWRKNRTTPVQSSDKESHDTQETVSSIEAGVKASQDLVEQWDIRDVVKLAGSQWEKKDEKKPWLTLTGKPPVLAVEHLTTSISAVAAWSAQTEPCDKRPGKEDQFARMSDTFRSVGSHWGQSDLLLLSNPSSSPADLYGSNPSVHYISTEDSLSVSAADTVLSSSTSPSVIKMEEALDAEVSTPICQEAKLLLGLDHFEDSDDSAATDDKAQKHEPREKRPFWSADRIGGRETQSGIKRVKSVPVMGMACPFRARNPLRFNVRDHCKCSRSDFDSIQTLK